MSALLPFVLGTALAPAYADGPNPFQRNIDAGRQYLFKALEGNSDVGRLGLGVMALLKTAPNETSGPNKGKVKKDAALQKLVDKFVHECEAKGREFKEHEGTYSIAVAVSCLIADDVGKHERLIRKLTAQIIATQLPNGGWAYPGGSPAQGDTSQVQYITLALWDAAVAGIEIPPRVWDSCLDWQISTQDTSGDGGAGGFVYHPSSVPEDGKPINQGQETATMGVAGLSTMLICQSQLPALKRRSSSSKRAMLIDELIRPAVDDPDEKQYEPKVTPERVHPAIARAEAWVFRNSGIQGRFAEAAKANYYLYGFERVAALRKGTDSPIASSNWYLDGGSYLARTQQSDGSWQLQWAGIPDTSFALLFLGRVMEKKIGRISIEMLQRSLAVGGTGGLPTADGTSGGSAFQRQYDRYKTQPQSSIDELVRIFEDPDKLVEEETAAKIEQLSPEQLKELVQKAGGDARKLRQWAYDKRVEARKAALAALSKTRDPRYAPILLDALQEKDEGVYTAAREGLRYLSRNVDVFGFPEAGKRSPEKIKAGVELAREWFKNLNVEVASYQEFTPPTP